MGFSFLVCLLGGCAGRRAAEDGGRGIGQGEAELNGLGGGKGLLHDTECLGVIHIVGAVAVDHHASGLGEGGRKGSRLLSGHHVLQSLLCLSAEVAAHRRLPALLGEELLRHDGEVEVPLTLPTRQSLRRQDGRLLSLAALGAPLRLSPSLLGIERLIGGLVLELALAFLAREHEAGGLLGGAAVLARLGLGEVQRAEEVGLVLRHEERLLARAADDLLAALLLNGHGLDLLGGLGLGGDLCGGLCLRCLGLTDGGRLALCVEAVELHLQPGRVACRGDLLLVRLDELLNCEGHSGEFKGGLRMGDGRHFNFYSGHQKDSLFVASAPKRGSLFVG